MDAPKEMLGPIAARVSEAMGREVDVVFLDQATIPLLRHLIDHCIVVYQAKPGAGAMWRSHTLAELETDGPLYDRMKNAWLARVAVHGLANQDDHTRGIANQDDHTRGVATQDDHMPVGVIHGQS